MLVPCVLRLLSPKEYEKAKAAQRRNQNDASEPAKTGRRNQRNVTEDPTAPKTQGALILQSMLRLPYPYNQVVLDRSEFLILFCLHCDLEQVCSAYLRCPWRTSSRQHTM